MILSERPIVFTRSSRLHSNGPAFRFIWLFLRRVAPVDQSDFEHVGHVFCDYPTELPEKRFGDFVQIFFVAIRHDDRLDPGAKRGQ